MKIATPCCALAVILCFNAMTLSSENDLSPAADRGKKALLTRAFNNASWSFNAYDNAWKYWESKPKKKPANYRSAFLQHYGLHPAPYANKNYPMGLREGPGLVFGKGLTTDCMLCHGGTILGKSYVGLGNSTLDIEALFSELDRASGRNGKLPFTFGNVRGTSEAAGFAVFLLSLRDENLNLRLPRKKIKVHDDLCEDVPAWWLLKKKKTMYHTGSTPARSVRSIMQFILGSRHGPKFFEREEATFRDIQAYILSLEAPKYPFSVDEKLSQHGKKVFNDTCARCHGTYGKDWTYPNKIVPMKVIGTDRRRFAGLPPKWTKEFNKTWFAQKMKTRVTRGYQAPPLDGVWATAPYFHNGSVPTLYHVLNSKSRPKIFTRSFRTDESAYDKIKVGWKIQVLRRPAGKELTGSERRKIYNTNLPGRGNSGHTFGDGLTDAQRRAVIEYLKTL